MNFLLALILTVNINILFSSDIVFVANEGNFGASNGSISMIFQDGSVYQTDPIGDVVQALEVYGDKLIVLVNNSHKIKIYNITPEGLAMPGIEVSTNGSGPRDLVALNDKVYFTNYNTQDVKVFNLFTYSIEASIPINGLPEDIEYDGEYLWVTIPHSDSYFSTGNTVSKIDIESNSIVETIEVGDGPQQVTFNNGYIYISRTFYDDEWNTFHGTTKITDSNGNGISEAQWYNYGAGAPCGGSIIKHQNTVYRSFDGGLAQINEDLSLENVSIGNFDQSQVYHVEKIDDMFWFAITNYQNLNEVHVLNENGDEISIHQVGLIPGDFAVWNSCSNNPDITEDGILNISDVLQVLDIILDANNIYDCSADINLDGNVDVFDIIEIIKQILD